ncbi:MAG: TonB-dependent receptor, partial [Bacteroidota bacterium]
MVEQVEVVYGPASALYGADAFSGVINIVTKKPTKTPTLRGSVLGGMYNTLNSNIFLTQRINDKWDFSLGGHFFYDAQPDLTSIYPQEFGGLNQQLASGTFFTSSGDTITPIASVDPERGNPLEASSIYGRIARENFSLVYFQNHGHNPSSAANKPSDAVYNKEQFVGHDIRMLTAKYNTKIGNNLSTSQLTYSRYILDPESNFRNVFTGMEPAYIFSRSWKLKAEQLFVFQLTNKIKLTSGITYERFNSIPRTNDLVAPVPNNKIEDAVIISSIAPNNLSGIPAELITTAYSNVGALSQLSWQNPKWNLTLGLRADKDDRYDLTINPRVGLIARPSPKVTLKGLFGTAYLAPSPQNISDRFGKF